MDNNKDDQDKKNNNINHNEDSAQAVSDDELLSKLLDAEEYEEEDSDDEPVQAIKKNKSFKLRELSGVLFAALFITFVILLVYMKYSNNCGLLGDTIEGLTGNYLCEGKKIEQTEVDEKNSALTQQQQQDTALNTQGTDSGLQEKLLDKDGVEIIEDPFAEVEKKEQESAAQDIKPDVQESLTEQQQQDLAATFDKQPDSLAVQPPPPPKPVYETPALLISETKLKITNRQPVRIKSLGFKDGQEFKKSDILVTFDCKQIEYDLDIQKEILKERQASLDNLQKLKKLKSTSEYSVVKAESELGQTQKLIAKYEDQMSDCVIKADYSGKVVITSATEGEFLFAGKEIMTVVNNEDLLIKAYIPVDWLDWLQVGTLFKFCIDQNCYDGVVNRVGAEVDAISQTLDVFGRLQSENNDKLIPGLSGQITFDKP